MNQEILDSDLHEERDHQKPNLITSWLTLILLWLGIAASILVGYFDHMAVWAATALLLLVSILTYFNAALGVKLTLVMLFLGVVNLIDFFPISYEVHSSIGLDLEFLMLGLAVLHYFLNRGVLSAFLSSPFRRNRTAA